MGRNLRWTAGVVAVITLAACGSSAAKSSDRPTKVDISTWRAGTESGTARTVHRSTASTPGTPDEVQVEDGVIDFDRHLMRTRARITSGSRAGHEFEIRQIGDANYWWSEGAPEPSGRPWMRTGLPWAATNGLADVGEALRGDAPIPGTRVTRTGTDTVRETPVTTYRIEYPTLVPPRVIARGYPPPGAVEVAVDGDGRIRRVRRTIHRAGGTTVSSETELFDFGAPITVTAPPADETDTPDTIADGPPNATGDWTDLATDGTGAEQVVVSAVPTDQGVCLATTGPVPSALRWWTVAGRETDGCFGDAAVGFEGGQVDLEPIDRDRQLVRGRFDAAATAVTLHLDDGSSVPVAPWRGAFAAIVHGDRVVESVEAAVPSGMSTCDFRPEGNGPLYACRDSFDFGTAPGG